MFKTQANPTIKFQDPILTFWCTRTLQIAAGIPLNMHS